MLTECSKNDKDCSSSGVYIKYRDQEVKIQTRNPDSYSVFHSEIILIKEGMELFESLSHNKEIWILIDSRSCIQHLTNWQSVRDSIEVQMLKNLKRFSTSHQIHLQCTHSHIDIEGNDITDTLDKVEASEVSMPTAPLTYFKIFSSGKG
ncbi:RNase H domain-containing protein [Nephila pilipes]|uniref:RNase H domain-containing protein n=1 Tax=Nephila pilipes TaxID=299642 RepID=A0A8X6Q9G9_NEPPI|nr:RNase H domain-containing protein [Nephila pilipes]